MIPSLDTVSAFLLRFDTVFNTVPQHQQEAFSLAVPGKSIAGMQPKVDGAQKRTRTSTPCGTRT
jgi:hypothetical protein